MIKRKKYLLIVLVILILLPPSIYEIYKYNNIYLQYKEYLIEKYPDTSFSVGRTKYDIVNNYYSSSVIADDNTKFGIFNRNEYIRDDYLKNKSKQDNMLKQQIVYMVGKELRDSIATIDFTFKKSANKKEIEGDMIQLISKIFIEYELVSFPGLHIFVDTNKHVMEQLRTEKNYNGSLGIYGWDESYYYLLEFNEEGIKLSTRILGNDVVSIVNLSEIVFDKLEEIKKNNLHFDKMVFYYIGNGENFKIILDNDNLLLSKEDILHLTVKE
ncbi:hypothetical protein BHU72_15055 [Desulfuribacillus stibiiarsenatis]|uniref:Uncharacterized protein n=1 Tax=Desulfuribacillus stibiiarsenatis TaxID=1390249 RepID=A0A1E5L696_9FIRM|nr:hypothetical protein [Desulfuribacillus stibiiarsenatis]OEH85558.1 hypothetical protein BHU72_15055 [Desulfuribacillus stibiiarsenatis]